MTSHEVAHTLAHKIISHTSPWNLVTYITSPDVFDSNSEYVEVNLGGTEHDDIIRRFLEDDSINIVQFLANRGLVGSVDTQTLTIRARKDTN